MSTRILRSSLAGLAMVVLCACENYDFTVNDRLVYTPKPLFTDFEVADDALRACLEQAIVDNQVSAARELAVLNCGHAGIADLQGLATFTGITHLKLSANAIRNLHDLRALSMLQELYLDDNQVVDPVPLYELPALRVLDLSGNAALQCPGQGGLVRVEALELPEHCQP
jgi:hypothetical protein